jgi:hypothetical protein
MSFQKMVSMPLNALRHVGHGWTVLLLLYAYGTLHFGFAIFSIFGFQNRSMVVALHLYSTPVVLKALAMAVWIGALLVLLARLAPATCVRPEVESRFLTRGACLLGVLAAVWLGKLMAPALTGVPAEFGLPANWLEIKGAISAVATWATALAGTLALLSDKRVGQLSWPTATAWSLGPALLGLVIIVAAVSLAELWTGLAYASEIRGAYVASRASSTLFNPNVLGLWAAFTTIGVALLYCENLISKKAMRVLCVLLAFAILASGSRSAFIPLVIAWLLLIAGLRFKSRTQSCSATAAGLTWSISLVAFSVIAHGSAFVGAHGNLIESLIWNSNRLFGSFTVTFVYILSMLSIVPEGWAVLPENAQMSMDGRFVAKGSGVDSDYLAILIAGGWEVLAVWLSLWLFVALQAASGFWRTRHRNFCYAGVLIALSGMAGLGMRATQLFPVSIFVAIALAWALFFTNQELSPDTAPPK